jgi:hypothetical protein
MILECLTKRVGVTPVPMQGNKYAYQFMQVPFARKGEATTSICEIANPEHINFLLGVNEKGEKVRNSNFREYDPEVTKKELDIERFKSKAGLFIGLSIEKWLNKGYILKNSRADTATYCASNTDGFIEDTSNLVPWEHEIEAYMKLKEMVADGDIEGPNDISEEKEVEDKDTVIAEQSKLIAELQAKLAEKPKVGRPKVKDQAPLVNLEI